MKVADYKIWNMEIEDVEKKSGNVSVDADIYARFFLAILSYLLTQWIKIFIVRKIEIQYDFQRIYEVHESTIPFRY